MRIGEATRLDLDDIRRALDRDREPRPFIPPIAGLDAPRVHVFRTLEDYARIRSAT